MSTPIVITVPTKYVPINLAPAITIKTESMPDEDGEESTSSMEEFLSRGKKRRLDHLTWEEKLQRKKLKNRVAAQTSRDRKKAKMEDMEKTVQEQSDQINELQSKCDSLEQEKNAIYGKYLDLEGRFEELKRRLDEQQQQQQQQQEQISTAIDIKTEPSPDVASDSVGCVSTLLGSAASAPFPLQQGPFSMETQTTLRECLSKTTDEKVAALWRIIALCLLYRTCSKTSMCPSSKSSPKASWPTSPASWKSLIEEAARQMPKMQAPAAECLDQWWGPHQNGWNPAKKLIKEAA